MKKIKSLLFIVALCILSLNVFGKENLTIIPRPSQIELKKGVFTLDPNTTIQINTNDLQPLAEYIQHLFTPSTGFPLKISNGKKKSNSIILTVDLSHKNLGNEGYNLSISSKKIKITASGKSGIFYAIQTLRQLLPPQIEQRNLTKELDWNIPCVEITDIPKYPIRGLMLDTGRQFHTVDFVKRYIDLLAMMKMNTLHWHLTELDAWRIEIKKYPKLTQVGAFLEDQYGEQWGYYTQEDIREVVDYAKTRYINIMPEIEIPGHSYAAMASYPELTCTGEVPGDISYRDKFKVIFCGGKEAVYTFINNVLKEIIDLFPYEYIHIGGDEANKTYWTTCKYCQERMKQEGLKNPDELQIWMTNRIADFLAQHNRKAVCWDDVVAQPGPKMRDNVVVQWWNFRARKFKGVTESVNQGHEVICSPNYYTYLNFQVRPWKGYKENRTFDLKTAYIDNNMDKVELGNEQRKLVKGIIAALWTDIGVHMDMVDKRVFPRIYAISELAWHNGPKEEFEEFYNRVKAQYPRLDALRVDYGPAMKGDEKDKQ